MERYKQNYGNHQRKLKLKLDRLSNEQNNMLSLYEEEKRILKIKEDDEPRLIRDSLDHIHSSHQRMNPSTRMQLDSNWDLTKAAKLKKNVSDAVDNFCVKRPLVYYKPINDTHENTTRKAGESKRLTPLSFNDNFSRGRKKVHFPSFSNGSDRVMHTTQFSKSNIYNQGFVPGKESSETEKHKTSCKVSNPTSLTAFPLSSIWNSKSSRGREHQSNSECGSPLKGRVKNKVIRNYLLQDVFKRLSSTHEKMIYRPTEKVGKEQRPKDFCDYESLRECRYLRIPKICQNR
ncbi:hypothetical protein CHS0354_029529 [Potamilus streckersoni]|uniref:Uncharacterized protein n=1 Tax=Potamilus streckersoni TaxID=2493646 RepID=A0AAE0SZC7_9BIVA|nr:hypothetical protein CHS0354_029529 [Potamilus streckersoni]